MNELISQFETPEFHEAVLAIQQPRTDFQLAHFVVGQHDTEPRRWHQCVLELSIKIHAIKRAAIERRKAERKLAALMATPDPDALDDAELLRLDLEQHDLATVGAIREAQTLLAIFRSFGRTYSHGELMAAESEYWQARLTRQAKHSLVATGRIGVGDLDSFAQIGQPVTVEMIRKLELETCETISSGQLSHTTETQVKSPQSNMPNG